jgi:hypothetical protein
MTYVLERLLKFKTVPSRWDLLSIHDTKDEAEQRAVMFKRMIDGGRAKGGGEVIDYRVKEFTGVER